MSAAIAERLIDREEICDGQIGNDCYIYDQIVEVDSAEDGKFFAIIDCFMVLLVYLGPVVTFGYLVAPVVARLLRMPVSY
jgi:hypothetical protein